MAFQRLQATIILQHVVVLTRGVSFRFDVIQGFSPISLHDFFHVIDDGFRSLVILFLLLELPFVGFTFLGVVFCFGFDPFFFKNSCFFCHVFF